MGRAGAAEVIIHFGGEFVNTQAGKVDIFARFRPVYVATVERTCEVSAGSTMACRCRQREGGGRHLGCEVLAAA